jgi:preprotein translocase SecE subunit
VAYKSDQGRYARMAASWALLLFWAFGSYKLWIQLQSSFAAWMPATWHEGLRDGQLFRIPVIGGINLAKILAVLVFIGGVFVIRKVLERPKFADLLISTEAELRNVTWPTSKETYNASVVVIATVVTLVAFLWLADIGLTYLAYKAMGLRL